MSTLRKKPVVGQKLYELYIGHVTHGQPVPALVEVEVTKVGRKYFTVSEDPGKSWMERQYLLSNWMEDGKGYVSRFRLYESRQEREDEQECLMLRKEIIGLVDHGNKPVEMLRTIYRILAQ